MANYFKPLKNVSYAITFPFGDFRESRSRFPEDKPEHERPMQYGYRVEHEGNQYDWYTYEPVHNLLQQHNVHKGCTFTVCHEETPNGLRWSVIPEHAVADSSPSTRSDASQALDKSTHARSTREVLDALEIIWANCQERADQYFDKNTDPNYKLAFTFYKELRDKKYEEWTDSIPGTEDDLATNSTQEPPPIVEDDQLPF
tara:strand:- start:2067 stop:2666 length:600 start_codon:yes stop_codon:yes gene_type:complete